MKLLVMLILSGLFSTSALAFNDAPGTLFYQDQVNQIVNQDVTLKIPSNGQGKVVLKSSGKELSTYYFNSSEKRGRSIFHIAFEQPALLNADLINEGVLYMKGTYMTGNSKSVYYGDMYKVTQINAATLEASFLHDVDSHLKYEHIGGFSFTTDN